MKWLKLNSETMKSRTFWGGVALIATGIGLLIDGQQQEGLISISAGFVAITGRDAISKKGK